MNARWLTVMASLVLCAAHASAQDAPAGAAAPPAGDGRPGVELADVIERVAAATGREFVLDPRLPPSVDLGGTSIAEVTYPLLLSILRVHGWFAHEDGGRTLLLPAVNARTTALRVLQQDDADVPDDQYVTRVIRVRGLASRAAAGDAAAPEHPAGPFVPVLRPLVTMEGHLSAIGNHLIVVDRYDNVRRITTMIQEIDR
jgi:type II secretory pathway component GspD/PulD (secretin)